MIQVWETAIAALPPWLPSQCPCLFRNLAATPDNELSCRSCHDMGKPSGQKRGRSGYRADPMLRDRMRPFAHAL